MMLRIFVAAIVVGMSGCADDSSETARMTKESHLPRSPETMEQLICDLAVSCLDGVKIAQSANDPAECDALEKKSHTFDYDECGVVFTRGTALLLDVSVRGRQQ